MAAQQGNNVLAKLGVLQKEFLAVKDNGVQMGRVDLPDGINNGIAQLVDCKISLIPVGKKYAGNVQFYAAGIVISPEEVGNTPIKGLRTSVTKPVCATPDRKVKTAQENLAWVVNELKKLGADFAQLEDIKNLELVMAALRKKKPFFRFRTWKGAKTTEGQYKDKEPMIQHYWQGFIADYVPGQETDTVDDHSGDSSPQDEDQTATQQNQDEATTGGDTIDLDALAVIAADDDHADQVDTQNAIRAHGMSLGLTEEELDKPTTWEAVVTLIKEKEAGGDDTQAPADEPPAGPAWEKGDVCKYHAQDPNTKKPAVHPRTKKAMLVECEITVIDKRAGTCSLKNLDDPKMIYTKVKLDDLVSA